jgi:hypothetical protein
MLSLIFSVSWVLNYWRPMESLGKLGYVGLQ